MLSCIQCYESASGQYVYFEKTELTFSQNMPSSSQTMIQDQIGVKTIDLPSKYLALPLWWVNLVSLFFSVTGSLKEEA